MSFVLAQQMNFCFRSDSRTCVSRMLQPVLPVFFTVQFNFLYEGWENKFSLEQVKIGLGLITLGVAFLAAFALTAGTEVAFLGAGVESLIGFEAAEGLGAFFAEQGATIQEFFNGFGL